MEFSDRRREQLYRLWSYLSTADHPTYKNILEATGRNNVAGLSQDLETLQNLGYITRSRTLGANAAIKVNVKCGYVMEGQK